MKIGMPSEPRTTLDGTTMTTETGFGRWASPTAMRPITANAERPTSSVARRGRARIAANGFRGKGELDRGEASGAGALPPASDSPLAIGSSDIILPLPPAGCRMSPLRR
jgi:hypothetical protein